MVNSFIIKKRGGRPPEMVSGLLGYLCPRGKDGGLLAASRIAKAQLTMLSSEPASGLIVLRSALVISTVLA